MTDGGWRRTIYRGAVALDEEDHFTGEEADRRIEALIGRLREVMKKALLSDPDRYLAVEVESITMQEDEDIEF